MRNTNSRNKLRRCSSNHVCRIHFSPRALYFKFVNRYLAFFILVILFTTNLIANEGEKPPKMPWSFQSILGTYDRAALKRGFQVYHEVCAACHSLDRIAYRHLAGIGLPAETIKALAAEKEVRDGFTEEGEIFKRPGKPSDQIVTPYINEKAARAANNGALPPDLSLIVKARAHGPDYLHALLTGYADPPKDVQLMEGMHYNKFFPGHQIAMIQPLRDGLVTYTDGTPTNVDQLSRDVVTFLTWAGDPKMEERKKTGFKVMFFLLIFTFLMFVVKGRVWRKLKE
jgi:ubiquinol-cytochrome c reductase cytochrome c1 subunit